MSAGRDLDRTLAFWHDCLGLALEIWSTVKVRTVEGGPTPRESGAGRLVRQGVQAAFEGRRTPRLDVTWDEAIKSEKTLMPAKITDWNTMPLTLPDANGLYRLPAPGLLLDV